MKKLADLIAAKAAKERRLDELQALRIAESRDFSADEAAEWDRTIAEAEALNPEIVRLQQIEDRDKQSVRNRAAAAIATPEEKVAKAFSMHRAVSVLAAGQQLSGAERELDQEGAKQFTESGRGSVGNLRLPDFMVNMKGRNVVGGQPQKRDLTAAGAATGDELVEDNWLAHVYGLNVMPKVLQLGATLLPGLTGDVHLTKTGVAAAVWAATENATSTETTPGTYRISMTPKRATAYTELSKTLMAQRPGFVDAWIKKELETALAVLLDSTAINGAGSGGAPTGILNFGSGVNSVAMGTDGGTPTRAKLIEMETLIGEDNAMDLGSLAFLTTPGVRGYLKDLRTDTGSGIFVWGGDNTLVGHPAFATTNVPSTLTKGASSGNCHAIILGVWDQLLIGQWSGTDLTVDPFTRAKDYVIQIIVNSLWDINTRHLQAFCHMKDAKTA